MIPLTQAELWHSHRHSRGRAKPGELVEDSGADLYFCDLVVELRAMTRSPSNSKQCISVSTRLRR